MKNKLKKSFPLILLSAGLILTACGGNIDPSTSQIETSTTTEATSPFIGNTFATLEREVLVDEKNVEVLDNEFHTAKQKAYTLSSFDKASEFAYGRKELSKPRGVKVNLENETDTYIQYSLTSDFKKAFVAPISNESPFLKNLLTNTKYYYHTSNDATTFTGTVSEISVANQLPRNLDIDGVTNVRDLGGYTSLLGGTIKQNMYFRGGRLNRGDETPEVLITEKGYDVLTKELGVKTELDLRSGADEAGHMNNDIFPEINYVNVPMNTRNVDNILEEFKPQVKQAFELFADETNYPFYVHCKIGTDRTGAVSFLMGALLGMDLLDLCRDYMFSNFGWIGSERFYYVLEDEYFELLTSYGVNSLAEGAEKFLLDVGITQAQINTIRDIMIVK